MKRSHALLTISAPLLLKSTAAQAAGNTIRLGAAFNDSYAEPYFAADAGFFTRANLDVDVMTFSNGPAMVTAAVGKALDVGIGDAIHVAHAVNHGIPIAFIAGSGLYTSTAPTTYLCVAEDSPIRTAKELEGKTIAVVALASIATMTVSEWMKQNGADPSQVKFFEIPFPAMVPALERGAATAALIAEPFLSIAKGQMRELADAQHNVAESFYISGFFASLDWLGRNAQAARQLRDALYQSAKWSNAHQSETAAILAKTTKGNVSRILAMTRVRYATSLDPGLLQPLLDLAYKNGLLDKAVSASRLIWK